MTRINVQEIKSKDIMSKNLFTVEPDDEVSTAVGMMRQHDVSEVPVISDDKVVGMVSYETLLKKRSIPMTTKIENVMIFPPRVGRDDSIMDIAETMLSSGYRAVPVTDKERIIGIVSRTDLLSIIPSLKILRDILVKEIMTAHPHCVREDDNMEHARNVIYKLDVRAIPVVDKKNEVVGVIGIKDLAKTSLIKKTGQTRGDAKGKTEPPRIEVKSMMRSPVITIDPEAKIHEAVELMNDNDVSTVVVTEDEHPVGILTQYDFIELIASFKEEERVFVQISGLHEAEPEVYDLMFDIIQKYIKRVSKIITPKIFTVHVHSEMGRHDATGEVTLTGRLTTEHEMFYTKAEDWDYVKALSEMLSQMERKVRKDKDKRMHSERHSKK